jgi:hypothetical protein
VQGRSQIDALKRDLERARQTTTRDVASHSPASQQELQSNLNHLSNDFDSRAPKLMVNRFASRTQTRAVVQQALEYLSEAHQAAENDPATIAALGRAYLSVAETQWSPDRPSLNDTADAARTCLTAIEDLNASSELRINGEVQQVTGRIASVLEQNPATPQIGPQPR